MMLILRRGENVGSPDVRVILGAKFEKRSSGLPRIWRRKNRAQATVRSGGSWGRLPEHWQRRSEDPFVETHTTAYHTLR